MKKAKYLIMIAVALSFVSCGKSSETSGKKLLTIEDARKIEHVLREETEESLSERLDQKQNESLDSSSSQDSVPGFDGEDSEFEETNDTVYITANELNLRTAPSTEAEIVRTAKKGESFVRLAKGKNGWDKLLYDGQVVYASAKYLAPKDVSFAEPLKSGSELLAEAKKNFT